MILYIATLYSEMVVNQLYFFAVNEAASNDKGCPQMKYTAYSFYSNTKRNSWKMHFNVTEMLNVLSKVRLCY